MVKEKYPIEARERLKDKESVTHKVFNGQKKKRKNLKLKQFKKKKKSMN